MFYSCFLGFDFGRFPGRYKHIHLRTANGSRDFEKKMEFEVKVVQKINNRLNWINE